MARANDVTPVTSRLVTAALVTGLALLTISTWTLYTDTHNIVHWIIKIVVTVVAVGVSVVAVLTAVRSTGEARNAP
ncbi:MULTISPECIES: hypothetical protein [unclassified Rhodococcus (in: high G+C Gram-positive bacteria)]|uniref:hypothetical protein n=1 Tax=unclassified Rhodococcus (in: high G+C Gram-positive bacteria) TaxID=192944 RepID=UPI001C9B8959|nr:MULTISPECIES: hypothetical protein [unclassified Rhodococcus (in: high G+C Gram-positive bacteria)]MBY6453239.1 hypothetical protein [Rhodococcus sp. BP-315]MBY6487587.1 hypothetical protein [Rhodococcus sp. BP-265]MBY6507209.1 hypothetical protein [Rhodococcus sp. BP-259]MBY6574787.1 hypothetical protein [Rhodococcus sp. BP-253]MBY6414814.1 hypothetical protein [Rhodococcus sp. BP-320]